MPLIPKHQYFGSDLNVVKPVHDYIERALKYQSSGQSNMLSTSQMNTQSSKPQALKALLLDNISKSIVGLSFRYSDLLLNECYLVESLNRISERSDLHDQSFNYLIGCLIITPCPQSIDCLIALLKLKRFSAYHIFFTDRLNNRNLLTRLAKADVNQSIQSIHELSMDYYPVSRAFFHLNNLSTSAILRMASVNHSTNQSAHQSLIAQQQSIMFDRDVQGVLSFLRAVNRSNKQSIAIRYASSSSQAQTLALQVTSLISQSNAQSNNQSNNQTGNQEPVLLLILDRRDDPVTPLLTQWTYAAMVHELFGIDNNKVSIDPAIKQSIKQANDQSREKQAQEDLEQLVLSEVDDQFYSANQHSNFGELGSNLRHLFQLVAANRKQTAKFTSIEDMQHMLDKYPALRALSGSLTKHMTLVDCLMKVQSTRHLLVVSEIEQEIVCGPAHEHRALVDKIQRLLTDLPIEQPVSQERSSNQSNNQQTNQSNNQSNNQSIRYDFYDKLRVVLLYTLRYHSHEHSHVASFKQTLISRSTDSRQKRSVVYVDQVLEYYINSHSGTIYQAINPSNNRSINQSSHKKQELFETNVIRGLFKAAKSELVGIDNIFTQHKPLLISTVQKLFNGDLSTTQFPFTEPVLNSMKPKYRQLIVYVVGGACYEEYTQLDQMMQRYAIEHPNEEQDLIVGINAPPAPMRSTSSETIKQSNNQSINQTQSQSAKQTSSSGGNTKKLEKFGADVFGAVRQVGGAMGNIVNVANVVIPKWNPREYRALIGGSCIHNSRTFLHEIYPIDEVVQPKEENDEIQVPSIEAAVRRNNQQYATGGAPRGRGRGRGRGAPAMRGGYRQVQQ